jgi:hypothetical protein
MKNTMIAAVGSLVMGAALTVAAVAQVNKKIDPPKTPLIPMTQRAPKVDVKCNANFNSDVATKVELTNNTAAAIPAGKKIFWKTNSGIAGQEVLQAPLGIGGKVSSLANTPSNATACTAYFIK